jgi:hypothetical protein
MAFSQTPLVSHFPNCYRPVSMTRVARVLVCFIFLFPSWAAPLTWKTDGSVRWAQLPAVSTAAAGFTRIDPASIGIQFTNILLPARKLANANLMNGSGVALGDYDRDGNCDVYLCDLNGHNRLYRNLGDWEFQDVTEQTGTACPNQTSTGAVFADLNGDGLLDLLVTSMGGPQACFVNLGNGRFTNVTAQAGFGSRWGASSISVSDVDGNGTMDVYVCNYGATSILRSGGALNIGYENGHPVVRGRYANRIKIINGLMWELGEPDTLYLNDGLVKLSAVPWSGGAFLHSDGTPLAASETPWDQGLSVIFRDIDRDGYPDIYVCNDAFTPDRLWINDGHGHFRSIENLKLRTTSHFSMGVDFGDLDRDGKDEFLVVDMLSRQHALALTQKGTMPPQPYIAGHLDDVWQMRRNTFLINDGAGGFSDIAFYAGIAGSEWSWCPIFIDVDLDGWEDILISNGFEHNTDDMDIQEKTKATAQTIQDSRRMLATAFPILATPNVAFHNKHDLTFDEVGKQWGFDATDVSMGMAVADLDNDGDLDVVVNCLNSPPLFYRNNASAPLIGVRLKGRAPNTQGVGARITVTGGPVTQSQEVMVGGRYVSSDDPMRVFAAGSRTNRLGITVDWRNGTQSVLATAEPGYIYEFDQAGAQIHEKTPVEQTKALFTEVKIDHKNASDGFDDFVMQPSLPFHLSSAGPGVIFADVNGDGWDDIVTGAGRTGSIMISTNDGRGGFKPIPTNVAKGASAGLILWPRSATEKELLLSQENYAQPGTTNIRSFKIDFSGGLQASDDSSVFQSASVGGPLALSEVNGKMTLFWGARFAAGQYPESVASHLYRLQNGNWTQDTENDSVFAKFGVVSSAIWTDLDGDGNPELVVACQWSPLRIFSAPDGKFVEKTEEFGLSEFSGLWQSVAAADLDGDGRMDLVAGNWGLNSWYNQAPQRGVELYYGEFNSPGETRIFETYFEPAMGKIVPWRDRRVLSEGMPWLNEKFPTHAAFAKAGIDEILQGRPTAKKIGATSLASAVFLNRGPRFEQVLLPAPAQYAPAFGIVVADFDNDGRNDLFLAQNFFAVRENDSRLDAGRGLLLMGTGDGRFIPVFSRESGIAIYGEQRGCAVGDFDHDGRADILVAQHANDTRLFANHATAPGITIRFTGEGMNGAAVGAQFQIGREKAWGPLHEVQIGSGYWSQNSLTQIVPTPKKPAIARVRWPGQKQWTETPLPDGRSFEIMRDASGIHVTGK